MQKVRPLKMMRRMKEIERKIRERSQIVETGDEETFHDDMGV
jgi:hypothetical protein